AEQDRSESRQRVPGLDGDLHRARASTGVVAVPVVNPGMYVLVAERSGDAGHQRHRQDRRHEGCLAAQTPGLAAASPAATAVASLAAVAAPQAARQETAIRGVIPAVIYGVVTPVAGAGPA